MSDSKWVLRVKFAQDQPRVPAGDPEGGQWTSAGATPKKPGKPAPPKPKILDLNPKRGEEVAKDYDQLHKRPKADIIQEYRLSARVTQSESEAAREGKETLIGEIMTSRWGRDWGKILDYHDWEVREAKRQAGGGR